MLSHTISLLKKCFLFLILFSFCLVENKAFAQGDCLIFNVEAIASDCEADGTFTVELSFDTSNVGSIGFQLVGNGVNYGLFDYADAPLQLGPFEGDGFTPWEFGVIDIGNPACNSFADLGTISCSSTATCSIGEIGLEAWECEEGSFLLDLFFESEGGSDLGYSVLVNGIDQGVFSYDLPFVTLGPFTGDGETLLLVEVIDAGNSSCSNNGSILSLNCETLVEDCVITAVSYELQDCNVEDGMFYVLVEVEVENPDADTFTLQGNGNSYGTFSYTESEILVGPFLGDGLTSYELVAIDTENSSCSNFVVISPVDCLPSECTIGTLQVETWDCVGETFLVDLFFDSVGGSSSGYNVIGNGVDYGTFSYSEPFITLGPFNGDGTPTYELFVIDTENNTCSNLVTFGPIDCGGSGGDDCQITEVVVEAWDCLSDGTFLVDVEVNVENPDAATFTLQGNGNDYGTYEYSEAFVTLGPFAGDAETIWEFVAIDTENPSCSNFGVIGPVDCDSGSAGCTINSVLAEASPCQDGTFFVDLAVSGTETGVLFSVQGNGNLYGNFSYAEPFITLGPFVGDGETVYEFVVVDVGNPACTGFATLGPVICASVPCQLSNLVVDVLDCNPNGSYNVSVDFDYAGIAGLGFDSFVGGEFIGFYSYSNLPVIIEGINSESGFATFTVNENDQEECSVSTLFEAPECEVASCSFTNLIAEAHPCDEDGNFLVDVAFENSGGGSDGFSILGNGNDYGVFTYGEPFVTIGPIAGDGETVWEFILVDVADPSCTEFTMLDPITCIEESCSFFDIEVTPLDCNPDGTYSISLDFNYQGVTNNFFDLSSVNGFIDFFAYEDLPITISSFEGSGGFEESLYISDNDNGTCEATIDFDALICSVGIENNVSTSTLNIRSFFDAESKELKLFSLPEKGQLQLFSASGRSLQNLSWTDTENYSLDIEMNQLNSGLYFCIISDEHHAKLRSLKVFVP